MPTGRLLQTLSEREALLALAEQTTKQQTDQLEDRKRQTQELVVQAQLQEAQQVWRAVFCATGPAASCLLVCARRGGSWQCVPWQFHGCAG